MSRIPRDVIDAIRDRTDIVEVVGRHVRLQRRGSSFVGLCPFHQEKSPSFNVVPGKAIFHCFGCQASGDVFRFLMQIEGLSFIEAVKELAGPAGIEVEERELSPEERRALRRRATLYDVLEEATQFYETVLWTRPEGAVGRAYLDQRGMSTETARDGRLGFAPGGWTTLVDHLHRAGFDPQRALEAGLARERRSGDGFYDTLRERVVFPIRDERGRVVAFGGRILEGDGPKYLNTPETRLYEKSKVLYGLHRARNAIQRADRALIVEGYFDVLALHQAGFEEAIATCGTALTPDHVTKLRRLTRRAVLVLDADEAGSRAAERTLPLLVHAGIQASRLVVPGAKDPDELIREEGADAFAGALDRAQPLLEWVVQRKLEAGIGGSQLIDDLMPVLVDGDAISRVAARARINEAALLARLAEARRQPREQHDVEPGPPDAGPTAWTPHRDVVHLLWLLVHRYDQVADLVAGADPGMLDSHPPVRASVARLVTGEPVAALLPEVEDEGVRRALAAIVARTELYTLEQAPRAVCQVMERLRKPRRDAHLAELAGRARIAARDGDRDALLATYAERDLAVRKTKAIERALLDGDVDQYVRLSRTEAPRPPE